MNAPSLSVCVVTSTHVVCPSCGKQDTTRVDHLNPGTRFGPWYCDHCGQGYIGVANGLNTEVTKVDQQMVKTLVLLEHDDTGLFIVVKGMTFTRMAGEVDVEHQSFFYDKSTCPTNYLGVEAVIENGDFDPHGVFSWRETIVMPKNWQGYPEDGNWQTLFATNLTPLTPTTE